MTRSRGEVRRYVRIVAPMLVVAACTAPAPVVVAGGPGVALSTEAQILRGRQLVVQHGCGDCHGGFGNPAADNWLIGFTDLPFQMIPVAVPAGLCDPGSDAEPCFRTFPRNLTPDDTTGLGRFSERQIFNALRYGLRPSATPDVVITSSVPGQGGHPVQPNYLAPGMLWVSIRHSHDEDLWAIAAYLKHGLRPVGHRVPDSEGPPDFWASEFAVDRIGAEHLPPFPTANEELHIPARREQVLRGRRLVVEHGCGQCHGGGNPAREGWLAGVRETPDRSAYCVFCTEFPIGEPPMEPFMTRPRNLTPDNTTGLGRFSERQIFNALRFGLRPGETPDVEITSTTPGVGNFPANPKYLAPPMPWPVWRHMSDADLQAIAAYLKHGLRPVTNQVADSEGPPDFWAGAYTVEEIGPHPAAPFPTAREVRR